jgi:hypothetical protein
MQGLPRETKSEFANWDNRSAYGLGVRETILVSLSPLTHF